VGEFPSGFGSWGTCLKVFIKLLRIGAVRN